MSFKPLEFEKPVLESWKNKDVISQSKAKNGAGKKFYFLQGPPYTSGDIHLGQAWNNTLKDAVLRFKRMNGFKVWDRAGYDMHGLPTENKVMKLHNLVTNKDIENFGLERFSEECRKFCTEKMQGMNTDLQRMGSTLDFSDPYQPISKDYTDGIWHFIAKVHKDGRLYKGKRTMMWCVPFATALAKHETYYKTVTDTSIFVKFKRANTDNEYFIIWTTTPWTIPFNLAIMVNPDVMYSRVEVESDTHGKEIWITASAMVGLFIQGVADKHPKVIEEMTGDKLEGIHYVHPLADVPAINELIEENKYPKLHSIILSSEYVDTTAGTGLVHCAPGCGPEDFEVGHRNGLPAFNEVTPNGEFPQSMGQFAGLKAKTDDKEFIKALKDVIVAESPIEHEYPYCERSHTPVIFRTTEQWFFKVEDLKEKMLKFNEDIHWVPQKAQNAFKGWLSNLRDNSITKQRFWGTPAPIWVCDKTGNYIVIASSDELAQRVGNLPKDLHKPYIDHVTFPSEYGGTYRRIPDVLDVWIDAGTASWNSLYYPKTDQYLKEFFPADFICEGKDQIRGWFNLLTVCSTLLFDKTAFENCYLHGFIAGVDGEKMSKSLGNIISPYEVVDKYGADTFRLYVSKVRAGEDISFSWAEIEKQFKNLNILYNVANYATELFANQDIPSLKDIDRQTIAYSPAENYILSKLQTTIEKVTKLYNDYELANIAPVFEDFLFELSRTYIQFVRDKALYGTEHERRAVVLTVYECLYKLLVIAHPVVPFITDHIYQNLQQVVKNDDTKADSLVLVNWPVVDSSAKNPAIEENFAIVNDLIASILAARETKAVGVRWPIGNATIVTSKTEIALAVEALKYVIKDQANVKEITLATAFTNVNYTIKPVYRNLKILGKDTATVGTFLAALTPEQMDEIARTIKLGNDAQVTINGNNHTIKSDFVELTAVVPSNIGHSPANNADVYIETTLTPALELEGLSREFTRRVQAARKDAELIRSDAITITIRSSEKLEQAIKQFSGAICERCGIKTLTFAPPANATSGTIKNETFEFSIAKI